MMDLIFTHFDSENSNGYTFKYSADMVMVLTGSYGTIFGISWLDQMDNAHAYTLTAITSPPGRHSFAHEWAHNLGARHDNDTDPGFAHGHNFGIGRILLAAAGINDNRELHYSNPDIDFNDVATGIVDQRDNARQLDNLGCTIAHYRSPFHPCNDISVFIDGPPVVELGNSYEWCAIVSDCDGGSLIYTWEYSEDGMSWETVGFVECLNMTVNIEHPLLRVRVGCTNNGCFNTGYYFTFNGLFDENCMHHRFNTESIRNINSEILFPFPNPTSDIININFDFDKSGDNLFELNIYSAFGKSVNLGTFSWVEINNKSINVSQYQDGMYFLTIESDNEYAISKFVVKH